MIQPQSFKRIKQISPALKTTLAKFCHETKALWIGLLMALCVQYSLGPTRFTPTAVKVAEIQP